ncbi:uncharacterized protein METZ01_LOCUS89791, partial [marine metagenome]
VVEFTAEHQYRLNRFGLIFLEEGPFELEMQGGALPLGGVATNEYVYG